MEGRPLDDRRDHRDPAGPRDEHVSADKAEDALVAQAAQGDVAAFDTLVRRYQELAFRTAYMVTGGAGEAEDAAQEAFVKAYLALPRFRLGSPFRPWLLTIVANEARNRRRSAGRRVALALRAGSDRPSGGAAPSPEVAVLADERRAELLRSVERLREDDRTIIACRYFLELSEAETAEVLNVPKGTVKSRLSRAIDRLRAELAAARLAPGEVADG